MAQKMTDKTGRSLLSFWERAAEKGWVNKNTALGYRAACQKILDVEKDWESLDVSSIDLEEMFQRFQNLRGAEYSPKSLETYRSRFRTAVETYLEWAEDPSAWRPPSPSRRTRAEKGSSTAQTEADKSTQNGKPRIARHEDKWSEKGMIEYPFPLRDDLLARLLLPRDLTTDEAKRLVAFVNALAIDEPKSEGE